MRLLFKLPSSLFPVPLRQNWHKETGSLFSWKEFQRLRSIQSSEEKKLVLGGKGVSYSDGCRKGSAHVSPSAELRARGGCCPAGAPCSPPPSPRPYLERTAAGTGAGGPSAQRLSCRPFAGRPGGARSRLLTHPRAGDATGSQWEAEPWARPHGPGL